MGLAKEDAEMVFQLAESLIGSSQKGTYRKDILVTNVERRMSVCGKNKFVDYLRLASENEKEKQQLISALTIHTTSWFREKPHFEFISQKLEKRLQEGHFKQAPFKVLSAACSTGEEVYSLALVLESIRLKFPHFDYRIQGTDIDPLCIEKAQKANYRIESLKEIPSIYHPWVLKGFGPAEGLMTVDRALRSKCFFKQQSLTDFSAANSDEGYDLIFCRNVLIYFEAEVVEQIIEKNLKLKLLEKGILVLGHSEPVSLKRMPSGAQTLRALGKSCYEKTSSKPTKSSEIINFKRQKSVLVVDDSATIRASIRKLAHQVEYKSFEVGSAEEASEEIIRNSFDLITLDLNMPGENGLQWLKRQRSAGLKTPVIIVSDSAPSEAERIFGALENGAQDYIIKKELSENPGRLMDLFKTIARDHRLKENFQFHLKPFAKNQFMPEAILVGISTGGPEALLSLLKQFPTPCPPLIIVQHITSEFAKAFAKRMSEVSKLKLGQIDEEGVLLEENTLYMSPGDYHLELSRRKNKLMLHLNIDEKIQGHRPSVDKLFLSAASCSAKTLALVMTGMGQDGAEGVKALGGQGESYCLAQDQDSSVVFGMPKKALETGEISFCGNLKELRNEIEKSLKKAVFSGNQ